MSSDTTPAPYVASASSFSNSTYLPWKAFNMTNINQDDCWVSASGTTSGWIQIDLSELNKAIVGKYSIIARNHDNALTTSPKSWTFEGSEDALNWTILDSRENEENWTIRQKRTYLTNIPSRNFRYYRLSINNNNGASFITVAGLEIYRAVNSNIYPYNGTIEFPTTDLGTHFREIKSVSSIKNIPENTNIKIYTSTSNNNITFSDYSLVDSGTGLITSPQGRYIKVKAELTGNGEESTRVLNDFNESEASQFITDEQIVFDGSLKLKNEYADQMVEDTTWTDEGKLFRKSLNKTQFKQIDKLEVR